MSSSGWWVAAAELSRDAARAAVGDDAACDDRPRTLDEWSTAEGAFRLSREASGSFVLWRWVEADGA